jgi:hypothetical protein
VLNLKAFSEPQVSFSLFADLQIDGAEILIEFVLSDAKNLFGVLPKDITWNGSQIPRLDGLWNATCFEAFLRPAGQDKYYEFNFSLKPGWNAYAFETYREPQPPTATKNFELKSMEWITTTKTLKVILHNKTEYRKFNISLTTILQEKNGNKHYMALAHKGSKPDFHLAESFTLLRGV